MAALATVTGLYPLIYFIIDRRFGLLNSKSEALLASTVWNTTFYLHIVLGGVALLVGWTQFVSAWRIRNLSLHRRIGKVYVGAALISAATAVYIALFATGGPVPATGFICMGVVWFFTTLKAYTFIRKKNVVRHQQMMLYSYATCLAAVTLRLYLPVSFMVLEDFNKAYAVVSWISWVPNLFVAYGIIKKNYSNPERAQNNRVSSVAIGVRQQQGVR